MTAYVSPWNGMPNMAPKNKQLEEAIAVLKQGGVVLFPTETAYGLAADTGNAKAVRRIYKIKGRDAGKQLPWIASDAAMAERAAGVSSSLMRLARKHWPGPLTVVGTHAAVRVSSHPAARALARGLGRPITATSANRAGQPACYSVRAFLKQLGKNSPDFILDVGALPRRKPSTIVAEKDGEIVVLRKGPIRL